MDALACENPIHVPTMRSLEGASHDTMASFKEQKMRQMAFRRGLRLHKARESNRQATSFGTYQLVDAFTGAVVFGDPSAKDFGKTLEQIEDFLKSENG